MSCGKTTIITLRVTLEHDEGLWVSKDEIADDLVREVETFLFYGGGNGDSQYSVVDVEYVG